MSNPAASPDVGGSGLIRKFSSSAAEAIYSAIAAATTPDGLEQFVRLIWLGFSEHKISEDDADTLQRMVDSRRPRVGAVGYMQAAQKAFRRLSTRFTPRQRPRSPDRKASRDRRRRLGGSSALPDTLRHHYTEGQRAVLCIIAGEVKYRGVCDLPIDKIAALAGVGHTTVQTTVHEARRLFHIKVTERPVPGRKHLTNIIEIICPEWRRWIKRGPSAHRPIGSNSLKMVSTTKITDLNIRGASEIGAPPKGVFRRKGVAPLSPTLGSWSEQTETGPTEWGRVLHNGMYARKGAANGE